MPPTAQNALNKPWYDDDMTQTYVEAYAHAETVLRTQGEEDPVAAARFLVGGLFGLSKSELILRAAEPLDMQTQELLEKALQRRAGGEPLQYILGHAPFRYLNLIVCPGVLIPRPETELLVDIVKDFLTSLSPCRAKVLDIGTGSGCIALSLISEYSDVSVIATDLSDDALHVAQQNAECLGFAGSKRLRIQKDDLAKSLVADDAMHQQFDVIVSNPPYIPTGLLADLPTEISSYEPLQALDGGADGLNHFRQIAEQAAVLLKPGGLLACELHESTLIKAKHLLKQADVWQDTFCHNDLNDCPRFVTASLKII